MSKRFLISTICLNRKAGLETCIGNLLAGNKSDDFDLVLTDQASTDGTGQFMDALAMDARVNGVGGSVTVFHEKENVGFQAPNLRAWRMAIKGGYKFLLLLNDDTIPPPQLLALLAAPFRANPKLALVGPRGVCSELTPDFHGKPGPGLDYIEGSCLCINVELVRRLLGGDLWDRHLQFIYAEDSCLSLRVRELGAQIATIPLEIQHMANATTMKGDPAVKAECVAAQEANHVWARKRWGHYLKVRRFDYPIVIQRYFAMGDVLLLTPLIRAIKKTYPQSPVFVETDFPAVLKNNPMIQQVENYRMTDPLRAPSRKMENAVVVDLNGSYENMPCTHIVDAYFQTAKEALPGLEDYELRTDIFPDPTDEQWAIQKRRTLCKPEERLAVIHAGPSWPGKTWHPDKFAALATHLVLNGWHVACVGAGAKPPQIKDCMDWTGQTPGALRLAALLSQAQLFVGIDSFPIHAAMALGVPTVGIFGVTSSRYIMHGTTPHVGVDSDPNHPFSGIRHRTTGVLDIKDGAEAIDTISLEQVLQGITRVLS